ncbi:MAG: hypothetical protein ACE5GB_08390 [Acidimicrobiales bacterium]
MERRPFIVDHTDRGQVVPLMMLLVLVAAAAIVVLGLFAPPLDDAARARTAADAAARAGAAEGRSAAADLAAANGGDLESYTRAGDRVTVVVRVGSARHRAAARIDVRWIPGG